MKYLLVFLPVAEEDIKRIKKSENKVLFKKRIPLLKGIAEHPNTGSGKPELLKHYKILS